MIAPILVAETDWADTHWGTVRKDSSLRSRARCASVRVMLRMILIERVLPARQEACQIAEHMAWRQELGLQVAGRPSSADMPHLTTVSSPMLQAPQMTRAARVCSKKGWIPSHVTNMMRSGSILILSYRAAVQATPAGSSLSLQMFCMSGIEIVTRKRKFPCTLSQKWPDESQRYYLWTRLVFNKGLASSSLIITLSHASMGYMAA